MRKLLSIVLVIGLFLSVVAPVAFADSWKDKGGLPPGIAKKFYDVDKYQWANNAIEKMVDKGVIKGVGEGKFAPQKAVTKLEVIVMALRVMGEDDEASKYLMDIKDGNKKLKFKEYLNEWAYGYVALAEKKGILDEADLLYFKLNEPATRYEVAKYLVRAIGEDDTAQDNMDADLDFKDASFIPQGSVGYIYIANKKGIITGYNDGMFKPFNIVTRAEMAVMIDRLDGIEQDDDYKIYNGKVTNIDDNWIEIRIGSSNKIFRITKDVKVVFKDDDGELEDIKVGDDVKIRLNNDNKIILIEVGRDLDVKKYSGSIVAIDEDDNEYDFSLFTSKVIKFRVDDDFEVTFDDKEGTIEDLRIGDKAEVIVEDDEVTEIIVDRDIDEDILNGILYDLYSNDERIAIKIDSKIKIYSLDENVKVYLNDSRVKLSYLQEGDKVGLTMANNIVKEINAYRY